MYLDDPLAMSVIMLAMSLLHAAIYKQNVICEPQGGQWIIWVVERTAMKPAETDIVK